MLSQSPIIILKRRLIIIISGEWEGFVPEAEGMDMGNWITLFI